MYIFVITSTLKPSAPNNVSDDDRYIQTINTIDSIKSKVPNSLIILLDSSPVPVEEFKFEEIKEKIDYCIPLTNHSHVKELGLKSHKSAAELYIMIIAMDVIKNLALPNIKRVFKITGRAELTDDFDISFYEKDEVKGKYVFQTPVVSYISPTLKLVNTRLWSFDYSIHEEVDEMLRAAYYECLPMRFDNNIEHVLYKLIDSDKMYGKDVVGLKCVCAGDGEIKND